MERFRIEVGSEHGVKPANIVGAIANEVDMDSEFIGHIEIFDNYSTVDLPAGMPKPVMQTLRKTWVSGKRMGLKKLPGQDDNKTSRKPKKPGKRQTTKNKKKTRRKS